MVDADEVSAALVNALPESAPVTSIEPILQGWGNESWIADTAIGRLIVKVGLPDADVDKWRAAAAGLALARSAGVSAPDLLAFIDAADAAEGRIMRVFRFLPGSTPSLDAPESFFRELGAEVRRLHSTAQPEFTSRVGGDGFDRWSDFLDLDNMLADDRGALVALLDFDMVEVWDPAVEFFKLDWFVFEPRPEARAPFMEGYLGGGALPPKFEQRVRLTSIIELMNHAASWRLSGQPDIANEALARLVLSADLGR